MGAGGGNCVNADLQCDVERLQVALADAFRKVRVLCVEYVSHAYTYIYTLLHTDAYTHEHTFRHTGANTYYHASI